MGIADWILLVIFVLLIITSLVVALMVRVLEFLTFWKGVWIILSYKGPKRDQ